MAIHTMMPVIDADELEAAVNRQFDCEINELRILLFDDDYQNYCYKPFWFEEMEEYEEKPWQDEEDIRLRNLVRAYLQDTIPDYGCALIDVSW